MDRGAWRATVRGATQRWTELARTVLEACSPVSLGGSLVLPEQSSSVGGPQCLGLLPAPPLSSRWYCPIILLLCAHL